MEKVLLFLYAFCVWCVLVIVFISGCFLFVSFLLWEIDTEAYMTLLRVCIIFSLILALMVVINKG